MAKLSYEELKSVVSSLITKAKISNPTFSVTRDNVVGLLDKVGAIITLDTDYQQDKLYMFDGFFMSFGKTIEEYQQDLILPQDYDASGSGALSPSDPTYRPVDYSYTLGRKVIPQTIKYNDIERAVHNEGQFVEIISGKTKALADSKTMMRYGIKRQLMGVLSNIALDMQDTSNADVSIAYNGTGSALSSSEVGDLVAITLTSGGVASQYLMVKPYSSTYASYTPTQLIENGIVIKLDLIERIAQPVDATTGENFIVALKNAVEIAEDFSEGRSLNGATLGATPTEGLYLVIKQGIMSELDVKTFSGAFHEDKVAIPTKVVVVPDLGDADEDVWAVLVDARGVKLHPTYDAVRENVNGDGDFLNMFAHYECTGFLSRNTYVRVFAKPE